MKYDYGMGFFQFTQIYMIFTWLSENKNHLIKCNSGYPAEQGEGGYWTSISRVEGGGMEG